MKLTLFRVSNYRNVLDSGWIDVGSITAFVGQNESGKSNLFKALSRINPFVPNETYPQRCINWRRAHARSRVMRGLKDCRTVS